MNILVIGGMGRISTYLVPDLIQRGHRVTCISRGISKPYLEHPAWESVRKVHLERTSEEQKGTFAQQVLDCDPDVVIDLICFTPDSARNLFKAVAGRIMQFVHCGTIWVHGHSEQVPTTEDQPKKPFCQYGIQKAAIADYLLNQAHRKGTAVAVLHPGHIVGPGYQPVNPAGNFNLNVFQTLASGRELVLPNFGMETVHHVHAADVAQAFFKAVMQPDMSEGQEFHVVSQQAMTLRGYAEKIAQWFGRPAKLSFEPFEQWEKRVSTEDAEITYDHIAHSPNCSIEKARRMLGYQPKYSSLEAVIESLQWLIDTGRITV